jgi:hypothetical protein
LRIRFLRVTSLSDQHHATEPPREPTADEDPQAPDIRAGFLGFVAHEMRNPLSTALWSNELLARLSPEDRAGPRGEKLVGMGLRALQRLRTLVEDHFLAERLDVRGIPLRPEAIAMKEIVATVAAKVRLEALTTDLGDAEIWADRGVLERLVEGLLAVAGRSRVPVRVTAERRARAWAVRVAGAPPPAEALATPNKGSPSDPTGRALALHLAVRAARALGGALEVREDGYLLLLPVAEGGRRAGPAT